MCRLCNLATFVSIAISWNPVMSLRTEDKEHYWPPWGKCATAKCNGVHKGIVVGLKYRDPNAPLHSCSSPEVYKSYKTGEDGEKVRDVMSSDDINQYFRQDERPLEKSEYTCRESCKLKAYDGGNYDVTVVRAGGIKGNVTCIERFSEMGSTRASGW
mmetsp:Transcript_3666/g.4249  ORF Transcript_3666/g.4249 Transcript_3666/m.4249 type:complete len:157 (-) Transcript_3666:12-482(-)